MFTDTAKSIAAIGRRMRTIANRFGCLAKDITRAESNPEVVDADPAHPDFYGEAKAKQVCLPIGPCCC